MNDDLLFADDIPVTPSSLPTKEPWRVLIVDDEPDVHRITRIVLANFQFDGRMLDLLSAHSGKEAKAIMASHNDIAMILLDVVMEEDHAGLEVARYVREELKNRYTRIILRTGQPGQAPEHEVIRNYDINDYKDKTELTTTKLNTLMFATLRSYRDICTLDEHRRGLENVIRASTEVFSTGAITQFASAVLSQVTLLLGLEQSALYCSNTLLDEELLGRRRFRVLAATGEMQEFVDLDDLHSIPAPVRDGFEKAMSERKSQHYDGYYIGYFTSKRGSESLLYVRYNNALSELDKKLLEIYATNVAISYENILMREEIIETQREILYLLGEAVEVRSQETGAHVKRVAQYSRLLALHYGLDENEANLIKMASPLHDVGKIGISDNILNKPGKLSDTERAIMKTHTEIGAEILNKSQRRILKTAAIIAGQHHEFWNGSGYPKGLKGEDIHIAGRITALADVFDALGSKRCYKEAWPMDKILNFLKEKSGSQFEPKLVEILLTHLDEFLQIRQQYPD
ncbi:MAG: hypothetical protein RL217_1382 [Pseudomonadota bacterium]